MTLRELKDGTKVDIRIIQKINRNGVWIDDQRHYASSIHHVAYDGTIELSMPMRRGKIVLLPMGLEYELIFVLEDNRMVMARAEIVSRYRKGKVTVLRAILISPIEKCQRREYYRLNCMIPLSFILMDKAETDYDTMEAIVSAIGKRSKVIGDGTITNISGGGLRFITEEPLAMENEYLFIRFTLDNVYNKRDVAIVGKVVGRNKVGDGIHYAYRTEILFKDSHCQEKIIRYIFEQERLSRKKGFGV